MLRHRRFIFLLTLCLLSFLVYPLLQKTEIQSKSTDYCLKNNVRASETFYSNIVYIPSLNILFCDVPKAASTNLRRLISGYLNPSNSLLNSNRKQIWIDYEDYFNKYYLDQNFQSILNETNPHRFKFLLVRHPFRRIYSVYYDKFVNNHLDDTLFGWKQLEEDILLEIQRNETLLRIRRFDIRLDFRTFILYIINSIRKKRLINSHWEQIVQRCAFCLINYHWIGKVENLEQDGKILIKKLNENLNQIYKEFPSKELDKKEEKKQIILNDLELVQIFRDTIQNDEDFNVLIDYYKPDFELFNYTMPHL
jgi:chondroitin 4-sulfotransferase 11